MKKLYPLVAVLFLFLLWGCPQKEQEDPVLTPIQTTYNIKSSSSEFTISYKTNQECSVRSDASSWLTVVKTKAVRSESVTVKAEENTSENSRSGNIIVTAGKLSATITVVQEGAPKQPDPPGPEPEDPDVLENAGVSTFNVDCAGGTINVSVRSNVEYTVDLNSCDWITRTKTRTVKVDNLQFYVAENTGAARTATISFTYGDDLTFNITVKQSEYVEPGELPYMEISDTDLEIDGNGGELTVTVDSNYPYTVDSDVDWVTCVQNDGTCVITVEFNPGEDARSAQLLFECEGLVEFVNIFQSGSDIGDPFDIGPNLSALGTANCYVVPKAGDYYFSVAVMGNGPDGFIWEDEDAEIQLLWPTDLAAVSFANYGNDGPSQVRVLWDDNSVVTNVALDKLKVSFTATGNKGNALIAVLDRYNVVLWSWHIWCTDSPSRIKHQAVDGTPIVMLDRNLGATSCKATDGEATYGYWYQFGRKDPFKLFYGVAYYMEEGQQSMEFAVENPTTIYGMTGKDNEWFNGSVSTITADLWGNPYALHNGNDHLYQAPLEELRKTIYDPCPPGYMVPPEWAWETLNMDNCTVSKYGLTFDEDNGQSFYPFAGYGDEGDHGDGSYHGDNGWYGYPGYQPNSDGSVYHHNCRNVVCCWSSGSEHAYLWHPHQWNLNNYHHANQFMYLQDEEASGNTIMVNAYSEAHLYQKYGHIRQRCCSVRCMRIQ